jgi:hypothetical protein
MKVYLIQFKNSDKEIFEPRIKQLGDWVKYFEDNYLISSDLDAKEIYMNITEGYDKKTLLIIQVSTTDYYGRMNTKVWDILKKNKVKGGK